MTPGPGIRGTTAAVLAGLTLVAVASYLAVVLPSTLRQDPVPALVLTGGGLAVTRPAAGLQLLEQLGLRPELVVVPGAGFVGTTPRGGAGLAEVLARQDLEDVRLLVLQAGEGDHHVELPVVEQGFRGALVLARERLPQGAVLVVVGPLPPDRTPVTPALRRVDEALSSAARDLRVPYLSGVRRGWTTQRPTLAADLVARVRPLLLDGDAP